jgi:hypothetical protein
MKYQENITHNQQSKDRGQKEMADHLRRMTGGRTPK